jgi:hypothetical protein
MVSCIFIWKKINQPPNFFITRETSVQKALSGKTMVGSVPRDGVIDNARCDVWSPVIVAAAVAIVSVLYLQDRTAYFSLLTIWMGAPYQHPFVDLEYILSSISCWSQGINVYAADPCDVLGRTYAYSPFLLRLTFLPFNPASALPAGFGVLCLFAASLMFIPVSNRLSSRLIWYFSILSFSTASAVERGNIDLLIFALMVGMSWMMVRGPLHGLASYVIIAFCGLLKIYPFVLFILLARERIGAACLVAVAAIVVLAAFFFGFHDELPLMSANIPRFVPPGQFGIGWGALSLPIGIGDVASMALTGSSFSVSVQQIAGRMASVSLLLAIVLLIVLIGWLSRAPGVADALDRLSPVSRGLLTTGAILIVGCFFAGLNLPYRTIFLLLALPAFLGMAQTSSSRFASEIFWISGAVMVGLLWDGPLMKAAMVLSDRAYGPVHVSFWLLQEACWWWTIGVLSTIILLQYRRSPIGRFLTRDRSHDA